MKRIENINSLNKGDKIWSIDNNGNVHYLEFICIHPHNENYSLFIDLDTNDAPKFWNGQLTQYNFYLLEDGISTKEIDDERIKFYKEQIKDIKG